MSTMEKHIGILVLLDKLPNETLEMQCKRIGNFDKLEGYNNNFVEQFLDECNGYGYILLGKEIYKLQDTEKDYDESYCHIQKLDNKTFSYDSAFYNGGTCLTEMIEEEFSKRKIID